jgi:hypothetical protein
MKTLYFDVDGTVVLNEEHSVKPALAAGRFESAIRNADFARLVCVGNFGAIAHAVKSIDAEYDELAILFRLCLGAFQDEAWFLSHASLITDPANRADHIDFEGEWWYVDDLAEFYLQRANKHAIFKKHIGSRICMPDPNGAGQDVLNWLRGEAL